MKKVYTKPEILFEDFSLSDSIAMGCAQKINSPHGWIANSCGYEFAPGMKIFTEKVSGCDIKIVDGSDQFNGICYHVPTDANSLFNS